jgi:preprotein translocase subunit SecG
MLENKQMGSRKFGSFLVVTSALAATFEVVISLVFNITPSSGPLGAIYSMFMLYYGKSH